MLGPYHPGITYRIVFVKNIFGEDIKFFFCSRNIIADYDLSFINLYNKTSGLYEKVLVAFFIHNARLGKIVVVDYLSDFEGMFIHKAVVASDHVSSRLFGLLNKPFVVIGNNPVIGIYKSKPLTLCNGKSDILGSALMVINFGPYGNEIFRILFAVIKKYIIRIIRRAVIDRYDFKVLRIQCLCHQTF